MRTILTLLLSIIAFDAFAAGAIATGEVNGRPVAAITFHPSDTSAMVDAYAACIDRGAGSCDWHSAFNENVLRSRSPTGVPLPRSVQAQTLSQRAQPRP